VCLIIELGDINLSTISFDTVTKFHEERNDSEATIFILGWAAFSHYKFNIFLGKAFTKIFQNVGQFRGHHGAILFLVVKLEDFNEIVVAATVLVLLDGDEHGDELFEFHHLLTLLGWDGELFQLLVGGVEVDSTEQVRDVPGIDNTFAIEIEDVEGELHPLCILRADISFRHLGD